jgi:hypothetical protein
MSLAQREVWNKGVNEKTMNNKHIEVIRFDSSKISIREYWFDKTISTVSYQPAIVRMIGARLLIVNSETQEEYYDCRYDDCTIKRMNG